MQRRERLFPDRTFALSNATARLPAKIVFMLAFLVLFSTGFSAVKYWSSTSATGWDLASNASAWSGGTLPANNDAIIFNSTSVVGCAWDIVNFNATLFEVNTSYTGTINITSNLINFGMLDFISTGGNLNISKDTIGTSGDSHYHAGTVNLYGNLSLGWLQAVGSTFNANGNINITSSFSQSGGTFNGNTSYNLTVNKNFTQTGGTFSHYYTVSLVVNGNMNLSANSGGTYVYLYKLTINNNCNFTIMSTSVDSVIALAGANVGVNATLSIGSGKVYGDYSTYAGSYSFINNGTISGAGTVYFAFAYLSPTVTFGNITANVQFADAGGSGTHNLYLGANTVFGGTLSTLFSASTMLNIIGNGYTLSIAGLTTIGAGITITQGTGAWNFSGGYLQNGAGSLFTQGGNVFVTGTTTISNGTLTGTTSYNWTSSGNFNKTGGTVTNYLLSLVMPTEKTNITIGDATFLYSLYIGSNVSMVSSQALYVTNGGALTVTHDNYLNLTNTGFMIVLDGSIPSMANYGNITGIGILRLQLDAASRTLGEVGNISSNAQIYAPTSYFPVLTMSNNITFGSNLYIWLLSTGNMKFTNGSNYALNVVGTLSIGTNVTLVQGTAPWTFGIYNQSGAGSLFTQGGNIIVAGNTTVSAGTLTGSASYNWTSNGNFVITSATDSITDDVLNLVMSNGYGISGSTSQANLNWRSITANGNVTYSLYTNTGQSSAHGLAVTSGTLNFTWVGPQYFIYDLGANLGFNNSGTITSQYGIMEFYANDNVNFPNIGTLDMDAQPYTYSPSDIVWSLSTDTTFMRALTVVGLSTGDLTLSHGSNYKLTVLGLTTLSTRGIMTQGTGLWNFSGGYTQSGADSIFTQGGNVSVTGDTTISAGTLTGSPSYTWTCGGNLTKTGIMSSGLMNFVMNGDNKVITWTTSLDFLKLTINGNTTIADGGGGAYAVVREGGLTIAIGKTLIIGGVLVLYGNGVLSNSGIITGGTVKLWIFANTLMTFGVFNSNFEIVNLWANARLSLGANTVIGGTLKVKSDDASYTTELHHGTNYTLDVTGLTTLGANATMVQGTGKWNFSDGYTQSGTSSAFTQGGNLFIGGDATFTNGAFTGSAGNLTVSGAAAISSATLTQGAGTWIFAGGYTQTIAGTELYQGGPIIANGFSIYRGNFYPNSSSYLYDNGNFYIPNIKSPAVVTNYALNLIMNGTGSLTSIAVLRNLAVTSGSTTTISATTITMGGVLNVSGTLDASTLGIINNFYETTNNWTIAGNGIITGNPAYSYRLVGYGGSYNGSIPSGILQIPLNLRGSADTEYVLDNDMYATDLTISYATTNSLSLMNHILNLSGSIAIVTGGILNGGNGTVYVGGDWESTAGTLNMGASTVVMTGSGKTITLGASQFNNLLITGSVAQASNLLAINANVTGSLNVTSGYEFSALNLSLNGGALNVVNGAIANTTLNNTRFWANGTNFAINRLSGTPPDSPAIDIGKYLNISDVGSGVFDVNFSYSDADVAGISPISLLAVYRYNGTSWNQVSNTGVDLTNYIVYATSVNSFGLLAPMANLCVIASSTVLSGNLLCPRNLSISDVLTTADWNVSVGGNIFIDNGWLNSTGTVSMVNTTGTFIVSTNGNATQGTGIWNFSSGYLQNGTGSNFTQGGNVFVMSNNFTISAGTFTGSTSYNLSLYTNFKFNSNTFSVTSNTVNLVMKTDGNTIGGTSGAAYWVPRTITINGNTTFSQPYQFYMGGLTVASGKLFNITVAQPVYYQMDANLGLNNLGTVAGVSGSSYIFYGSGTTSFPSGIGSFSVPTVNILLVSWASANATWTLAGNVSFSSVVNVYSQHASYYLTLTGSNYAFNSSGLFTLGANAIITQGTGLWNFSGGFTQNGAGSLFTQGGNIAVYKNMTLSVGAFTGSTSYNITIYENITKISGYGGFNTYDINLVFPTGNHTSSGTTIYPRSITNNGGSYLSIGQTYFPIKVTNAGNINIGQDGLIDIIMWGSLANCSNTGNITRSGSGSFALYLFSASAASYNMTFGNIPSLSISGETSQVTNVVVNLGSNTTISNTLSWASQNPIYNVTLNGSNFALSVNGTTTLGFGGRMISGTSLWNFSGGYTQNGANSTFTQGGNVFVTGNTNISAGTLTGSASYNWVQAGNFTKTAGTLSANVLNLVMSTDGTTISINDDLLSQGANSLTINGNVTINDFQTSSLSIAFGKTLTINSGKTFNVRYMSATYSNLGAIAGTGTFGLVCISTDMSITFGTINAPTIISERNDGNANRTLTLLANTSFGSTLTVQSDHATYTMTVHHGSNYILTVTGLTTLGDRGIMTQGTGTWNFSGGYIQNGTGSLFTQGGNVYVTGNTNISAGTLTGNTGYNWTCSGNFTAPSSGITNDVLKLVMTGTGKTVSVVGTYLLRTLQISGNIISTGNEPSVSNLIVDSGAALTIAAGYNFYVDSFSSNSSIQNDGMINGTGALHIYFINYQITGKIGTVNSPVVIEGVLLTKSWAFAMTSPIVLGSSLTVNGDANYGINLTHGSNYPLTVLGLTTLSTNGGMTQGTGVWNFSGGFTQNGAGSLFTQGGNVFVTGTTTISNGTLTGAYNWTQNGNFNSIDGTLTGYTVNLVMIGEGTTLQTSAATGPNYFDNLTINANVTESSANQMGLRGRLTIASGKTFTILSSNYYHLLTSAWSDVNNNGVINGTGTYKLAFYGLDKILTLGTINSPVLVYGSTSANRVLTLGANTIFNSLTVQGQGTYNMTLDLNSTNNYNITAANITANVGGIIEGRGSTVTDSGNFYALAGNFHNGTSTVIMTGLGMSIGVNNSAGDGFSTLSIPGGAAASMSSNISAVTLNNSGNLSHGSNYALTVTNLMANNGNMTQGTGLWNFSGGYLQSGANSNFTQGGNIYVGGNFNMTNGKFTGSISYVLTCSGNFSVASGGVMTLYVLTLNMTGNNTFVSFPSDPQFHGLIISGTVTLPSTSAAVTLGISGNEGVSGGLTVAPSAVFTMNQNIIFYSHHGGVITNNGYINGSGTLGWYAYDATPRNFAPGNITAPVRVTSFGSQIANSVFNLIGNTTVGSTLLVDSATGYNVTLNHSSNYLLTVNGLMTLGANGIMTQGTGLWNFSGGYLQNGANSIFTQGGSVLVNDMNITGGTYTQGASTALTINGNYIQTGGTFNPISSGLISAYGNFLVNGGTLTSSAGTSAILSMNGIGKNLNSSTSVWTLMINANTTIFSSAFTTKVNLYVANDTFLTLNSSHTLSTWNGGVFQNNGTITGIGGAIFEFYTADRAYTFGTINSPLSIFARSAAPGNRTLNLSANAVLGSSLSIYSNNASSNMFLNNSIYTLTILGSTNIGAVGGIMTGTGIVNFSGGYNQTGTNSLFVQGGNVSVTGTTNITAGTLTGNGNTPNYWTSNGNFSQTAGTITINTLKLAMNSPNATLYMNSNYYLYDLILYDNTNITGGFTTYGLTVSNGKLLTLKSGITLTYAPVSGGIWNNVGSILTLSGSGGLQFYIGSGSPVDNTIALGNTITTPITIVASSGVGALKTINMGDNWVITGTLGISSSAAVNNVTLSHGTNYTLSVSGLTTLGFGGRMAQGTGLWNFSGGYLQNGQNSSFTQGGLVNMTTLNITAGTFTGNASYNLTASDNVTFNNGPTYTSSVLNLVMIGANKTIDATGFTSWWIASTHILGNTTLTGGALNLLGPLAVNTGKTLSINSGTYVLWNVNNGISTSNFINNGRVIGAGYLYFRGYGGNYVLQNLGTFSTGIRFSSTASQASNQMYTMLSNLTPSYLLFSDSGSGYNLTLNATGGQALNVTDMTTVGVNGSIMQGSGLFNFSGGYTQTGINSLFDQGGNVYVNYFNLSNGNFIGNANSNITFSNSSQVFNSVLSNASLIFLSSGTMRLSNGSLYNTTLNNTQFWLNGTNVAVARLSSMPSDSAGLQNISKYLNVTNLGSGVMDLNMSYDVSQLNGQDESALKMYEHNGASWVMISNSSVDTALDMVYASNISAFSVFGIMGSRGWLDITYQNPAGGSLKAVERNSLFNVTVNVTCRSGNCDIVNGTLRYNSSGSVPNTNVSTTAGATPFYITTGSNPKSCGELLRDQTCQLNFTVNATGSINSNYAMHVNFTSSESHILSNTSANFQVIIVSSGTLSVDLLIPTQDISTIKNRLFNVSARVICMGGAGASCYNVNATLYYNLTSGQPNTVLNTTYGDQPFFTSGNPISGINLAAGELYIANWTVNASGAFETSWLLNVTFATAQAEIAPNSTVNFKVTITPVADCSYYENCVYPNCLYYWDKTVTIGSSEGQAVGTRIRKCWS